jgi:hypothetical protein
MELAVSERDIAEREIRTYSHDKATMMVFVTVVASDPD